MLSFWVCCPEETLIFALFRTASSAPRHGLIYSCCFLETEPSCCSVSLKSPRLVSNRAGSDPLVITLNLLPSPPRFVPSGRFFYQLRFEFVRHSLSWLNRRSAEREAQRSGRTALWFWSESDPDQAADPDDNRHKADLVDPLKSPPPQLPAGGQKHYL